MANYLDTVDHYESPLLNQSGKHRNGQLADPVRQVQLRMILIMGVSLIVAFALAFLALPATAGTGTGAPANAGVQIQAQAERNEIQLISPPAAPSGSGSIAAFFTPEVQYWESDIVKWASQYNVDPNAVATIMQIESCGDPQAVSIAGARGLFQVMPFHFSSGEDMLDPDTNALRGMNFLNEQLRYTGGDIYLSFAGYNGGYAASGGNYNGWPDETKRYYRWAKGIYEDATNGSPTSGTLDEWLDAGGRPGCQRAAGRLGI